ncbi:hypothetical protein TELCIR_16816, partial [Teladorsagia circumcincta]
MQLDKFPVIFTCKKMPHVLYHHVSLKCLDFGGYPVCPADSATHVSGDRLMPERRLMEYNGSWFVIARKAPSSRSFLPANVNSSMIRLQVDGDERLNMTEYHSINGTCMPPLYGVWTKKGLGYFMELRTENGHLFSMGLRGIYHDYSGEQNEEMNMVIYGCSQDDGYGNCLPNEELVMIMSNSRHPQTLQLFKSAKLIEDAACIDILQFKTLDTYTACGDEVVDEDQKLIHAQIDDNNEFVDVECRVENQRTPTTNIRSFFDEPRVLTVTAYIDTALLNEQIAHISCVYVNQTSATCEWIRQNTCFKTQLHQSFNGESSLQMLSNFTRLTGNETTVDWSGTIIWENGDEYISIHCYLIGEDGAYECTNNTELTPMSGPCGVVEGWTPLNTAMLQGVWYFAADLNADPKIFLQSAVITLTPNETKYGSQL